MNALKSFPWVDTSFVQNLIDESGNGENWVIESFHNGSLDNHGQNFGSDTIQLIVKLRGRSDKTKVTQKSFFMKVSLQSEQFKGVSDESLLFEKEIEVYSKILPAAEELLKAIDMPTSLAPK